MRRNATSTNPRLEISYTIRTVSEQSNRQRGLPLYTEVSSVYEDGSPPTYEEAMGYNIDNGSWHQATEGVTSMSYF